MGKEINLLKNYPKSKRDLSSRLKHKTKKNRDIARKFGKEFFDGDRANGYGGFNYNKKFWQPVIPTFKNYWKLNIKKSFLDVGCGKGFMLYDLKSKIKGLKLKGLDISKYAIKNSKKEIKLNLIVGNAKKLPFKDKSFDIVVSINTVHNLKKNDCAKAIQEIQRVSRKYCFITVDAYKNKLQKKRMYAWNLTAKTIMSVKEWKLFFKKIGYKGDYYWFIP